MTSPMRLPESFGRQGTYRVISELGRGGFATVYKAYHTALERYVAIKVLRSETIQDEKDLERFKREARAAARLAGHPNIVTLYDYGEQDGLVYLVLEYVDGINLQVRLTEPISASEIDRIVGGMAAALDYAHAHQLVHRDVKPSNVLLSADGRVLLSDFGIAKLLDATVALTAAMVGTPEYMAPEQITSGEVGSWTDIYALGVVAYRIFAGRPPFRGQMIAILHQHVYDPPPPMSREGRPVPPGVEDVIARSLAKNPGDRYATAGELAAALTRALRPTIVFEQAEAALGSGRLDQAEQLATELLVGNPDDHGARYVRGEVIRRRLVEDCAQVARLLEAGDWRTALHEIGRLQLRESGHPEAIELARRADRLQAAEVARIEAERQAEQERLRREQAAREAQERAERAAKARQAQEAREAQARAEREAQERADRAARERAEQEARDRQEREAREREERAARERAARRTSATTDPQPAEPALAPSAGATRRGAPGMWLGMVAVALLVGVVALAGPVGLFGDVSITGVKPAITPPPTALPTQPAIPPATPIAQQTAPSEQPTAAAQPTTGPTSPPTPRPAVATAVPTTAAKPTSPPTPAPTAATLPTDVPATPAATTVAALPPRITLGDGVEMALVQAGPFVIGSNAQRAAAPAHELILPAFYVDLTEITNARFAVFVEQARYEARGRWRSRFDQLDLDPRDYDVERKDHPVVFVTWFDADAYCRWAGKRLPNEAEWEKAARGTDGRRWPWGGDSHPDYANIETFDEGGHEPDTKPVGAYPRGASPYGALDMIGNVWEWTSNPLLAYPLDLATLLAPVADPATPRVTRGASWTSVPGDVDAATRLVEPPTQTSKDLGFRCVASAAEAPGR